MKFKGQKGPKDPEVKSVKMHAASFPQFFFNFELSCWAWGQVEQAMIILQEMAVFNSLCNVKPPLDGLPRVVQL